jgi:hypothetical protein
MECCDRDGSELSHMALPNSASGTLVVDKPGREATRWPPAPSHEHAASATRLAPLVNGGTTAGCSAPRWRTTAEHDLRSAAPLPARPRKGESLLCRCAVALNRGNLRLAPLPNIASSAFPKRRERPFREKGDRRSGPGVLSRKFLAREQDIGAVLSGTLLPRERRAKPGREATRLPPAPSHEHAVRDPTPPPLELTVVAANWGRRRLRSRRQWRRCGRAEYRAVVRRAASGDLARQPTARLDVDGHGQ